MQLKNNIESFQELYICVQEYYGRRPCRIFSNKSPSTPEEEFYIRFLVDRKHVVEYAIFMDRGLFLGSLRLAIGPQYFGASDFWSYEASGRFQMEASSEAIVFNLKLLDEFLGVTS